jgi:SAM-dependent methyltransferase
MPAGASAVDLRSRAAISDRWSLRCPACGAAFDGSDPFCPAEGRSLARSDGLLVLMRPDRRQALAPFLAAYRTVRRNEGWGGAADYYRNLPFDSDGPHRAVWRLRARSYRALLRAVEERYPRAKRSDEHDRMALGVLELGAGNGWLSWRMAERGHYVLATDVSADEEDGLGALPRYAKSERLTRALAEMEDLPLGDAQFDVVVASGSLHYARNLASAVSEARRVLREGGLFLVLDSPAYEDAVAGRAMVERREREHRERYGISPAGETSGFLVEKEFARLLETCGFRVARRDPFEGLSRRLRRLWCSLRGIAPPARFPLFVSEKRR